MLCQKPAMATIVYKGHVVNAWPDIVGPALAYSSTGNQLHAPSTGFFPHPKGTVKGLVLLVDFSDQAGAFTQQEISDWLNLKGYSRFGCNGSVRDFFYDMSNGIVDLQNTVRTYYRAKNTKAYYEGGSGYDRADELLNELIAAVDADVNFADYDNDKDGTTESISIVYAGPSVTWGQGLWPHSGWLGEKHDGVTLNRYQMTNMGNALSLYVFSHETGHMLFGWPDLYGFGDYCLMGNYMDPTNPVPVNDFFRADQGWIPLTDITASTNATFAVGAHETGYRYVNPAKSQELFFWSNSQNTGRWSALDGSGILMLHYDGSIDGNNPPQPLELAVVQADGKKDLDATTWPSPGSDANDYFRAGYKAEFSSTSSPKSSWNDGSASGLRVYAVSATGSAMQFSVGDGSAGGSPSTGGTSSTTGGSKSTGGTSSESSAFGGKAGVGGSVSGGVSSGGRMGTGDTVAGGAISTGGTVASGTVASGGAFVVNTSGTNPSGGNSVSGVETGGNGTAGLSAVGSGGAGNAGGGAATANGESSNDEDSGCSCSTIHRSPSPFMDLLFSLGGLAGILRLNHRRRRRMSHFL
jgi:M6 family metalloprotease-like protein